MHTAAHANFVPTACGTPGHELGAIFIGSAAKRSLGRLHGRRRMLAAFAVHRARALLSFIPDALDPAPRAYISPPDPILFTVQKIGRIKKGVRRSILSYLGTRIPSSCLQASAHEPRVNLPAHAGSHCMQRRNVPLDQVRRSTPGAHVLTRAACIEMRTE